MVMSTYGAKGRRRVAKHRFVDPHGGVVCNVALSCVADASEHAMLTSVWGRGFVADVRGWRMTEW